MRKIRVLLDFIEFTVARKIAFYRNVIACLTGSSTFTNPDVALTTLTDAVDKLEADYQAALSGLHQAVAEKHKSETAADDLFRIIARYVDRIANGNEAMILNAGFNPSKQPAPPRKPPLSVENGDNPGEAILRCKAYPKARAYTWQSYTGTTPCGESDWKFAGTSTQTTFIVKNLDSLVTYWFRVSPVTFAGMQPWIGPVMKVIV